MESRRIKLSDLPDFLMAQGGYNNLRELATEIGISRATLHNWKNGSVTNVAYSIREKLAQAIEKNKWGFRIGKFNYNGVELIYTPPIVEYPQEITYLNEKVNELQQLIDRLLKENFVLKDKLEKYEVKK